MKCEHTKVFRLKVTLLGVKPPIWRRISVPSDSTLASLHDVLQMVMGWCDCHLHQFIDAKERRYACGYLAEDDPDVIDSSTIPLHQLLKSKRSKLLYEYDFGDGWEHRIEVESIDDPEPGVSYPICHAGRRAGPPEDCGGPWSYMDLLTILADPKHADDERLEWLDDDFDPENFDLDEINEILRPARKRRQKV